MEKHLAARHARQNPCDFEIDSRVSSRTVAAGSDDSLTQRGHVYVLSREQEQVNADAHLDAFFGQHSIRRILRSEQCLFLVGSVQLGVLSVFERAWTSGWQRCLENVDLSTETLLLVLLGQLDRL